MAKSKKQNTPKEPVSTTPEEYESQTLSKKEQRKQKKVEAVIAAAQAEESSEEEEEELDLELLAKSDSESEDDFEDAQEEVSEEAEEAEDAEDAEEEDVPLSEVEFDSDADVVPHHKLTINNTNALREALARISLPWEKHTFQEHQSVTSSVPTESAIKDIYDDTERELAFYKQSLDAVTVGKKELLKLKVPFSRPLDYFAEMVKSDEHMDKLKSKLVREASDKKAREDARRQRDLKKFGKSVQVATLQQRQKEKRETLDKIKSLKKKRQNNEISEGDFNVGVEEAADDEKRNKRSKPNKKREAKNSKYGFGGMKRNLRKNDEKSNHDMSDFSNRKMKGKAPRPGKSKRTRRH